MSCSNINNGHNNPEPEKEFKKLGGIRRQNVVNMHQTNPLEHYLKKNYDKLAFSDLKQSVNNNGDTVIHIIAGNLDKAVFELILQFNPNAITYDVINMPNKKLELPIHKAMETLLSNNYKNHDFINYMVNVLGANPDIPDANDRIVSFETNCSKYIYDSDDDRIKKLNDVVINNIKNLTKLAESKVEELSSALTQNLESKNTSNNNNIEFIKDITNYYASTREMNKQQKLQSLTQMGGYNGRRIIKNYYSDDLSEIGSNDSFKTNKKNQMIRNYDIKNEGSNMTTHMPTQKNNLGEWKKRNFINSGSKIRMIGGNYFEKRNKIIHDEEKLRLEEEKVRNERLIGGNDNSETRRREKELRTKRLKILSERKHLLGGNKIRVELDLSKNNQTGGDIDYDIMNNSDYVKGGTNEDNEDNEDNKDDDKKMENRKDNNKESTENEDDDTNMVGGKRKKYYKNESEELNNLFSSDVKFSESKLKSKSKSNKRPKSELSDEDEDESGHNMFYTNSQERVRNEKVDEIYRSFVKKIMDLLGVDEETARFYRSAIKINLENSNPELKKRENDERKIKEMENIFENKKKLQETLDKIDMNKIKKYMAEKKEEGERRREEIKKEREKRKKQISESKSEEKIKKNEENEGNEEKKKKEMIISKPKRETKPKEKIGTTTSSVNINTKTETETESETSENIPKRKPKKKNMVQSRIVDDGYLQSDEILFSPDY